MHQRIENEDHHKELNATAFEKQENHLKRFLLKHFMDIEIALTQWHGWVQWRHGNVLHSKVWLSALTDRASCNHSDVNVDGITDKDIANEKKEGIVQWRG